MQSILINQSKKNDQTIRCDSADTYCVFIYNFSGKVTVSVEHEHADVSIFGVYIGTQNIQFKLNTVQHHTMGKSISDLLIKGIFFDESKLYYEGLIKIDKDAQQSNAYQKNQNILMSGSVFVDSRPYLEIEANDVRCTHGSTTGQLSEDSIQFLNLRGLNQHEAEKLLLFGFIEDVFNKIEYLGFKKEIKESKIECVKNIEAIFDHYATATTANPQ